MFCSYIEKKEIKNVFKNSFFVAGDLGPVSWVTPYGEDNYIYQSEYQAFPLSLVPVGSAMFTDFFHFFKIIIFKKINRL